MGLLPRLTVRRCKHVFVRDEDPAALVLGEEAEPRGLLDQHLPRPVAKSRLGAANDPALPTDGSHTAI